MSDPRPSDYDRELDEVIFSFADIQAELHYKQAKTALHDLLDRRLDLTPRERLGLEEQIQGLEATLDKLESDVVQIAAFGMVGRGKSSLLNALVGRPVFETGPLHGVTRSSQSVDWTLTRDSFGEGLGEILQVSLPGVGKSRIELVDTPGLDEVDGQTRADLAYRIAKRTDLILFVISGDITQVEYDALSQIRDAGKPLLLVFNKIDQYPEADRQAIYEQIRDRRVRQLLTPDRIVMAAASPLCATAVRRTDGSIGVALQPSKPEINELKLKILDILHREGKSLVALNSMLYADEVNEQVVQRKMEIRDRSANQIIWNAVIAKALAIALNPVTVVDILAAATIDVALLLSLSRLYGIPMTQTGAIDLLQKIALSMGGISASELLANLGLSGLKSLLGVATPVTGGIAIGGYVSVALTQASVAGVSTYGIGQVAKTYLANGASWGPDGPKAVVREILESLDETSILSQIKQELQEKLVGTGSGDEAVR
ncbi:MAG: GTP-binding protein [Cyanobacteria bacterium SBC]|nr:GTP-binding protein [Cyanobacteria bacterium SBC]